MRQILRVFILISFTAFLGGCPYDSAYNLDEVPLQNIDKSLLGSWSAFIYFQGDEKHDKKGKRISIRFASRTETEYDIVITCHIDELEPYHLVTNDSLKCTAYLSSIAGRQFLNAYIHGKVYLAEVIKDSSTISILPLA